MMVLNCEVLIPPTVMVCTADFTVLFGDFKGEMAILFGVCVVEFKVDPITPLSDIVIVFDGVPGVDCERTLPVTTGGDA